MKNAPEGNRGIPLPLMRWRGFTLQMFFFIVLPLSVVLLVIAFASQSLHHREMRALVGDRDLRAVRSAAVSVSHASQQRATAFAMLALQPGSKDAAMLDAAASQYGFDGGLAVFDASGNLIARSAGAAPEILDLQRVQQSLKAAQSQDGAASVGAFSTPYQSADGRWLVLGYAQTAPGSLTAAGSITAPGSITAAGSLTAAYSPASLARESLGGLTTGRTTVMLVSAQGDLLYQFGPHAASGTLSNQPGVPEVLRGESGVNYISPTADMMPDMPGMRGEEVIAFAPVTNLGWGLIIQEPWEEEASPLLTATQSAPLVLVPVLVLALVALWFGARQIIQPLQSLEDRAARLAAGDFTAIRQPVGGISEIRNLQDELVEMTAALESAQDALHGYIGALTAGVETERRSLARELHDDTLQALIALNQHVQMTMLRASDPQQRKTLEDLQTRVTQTIASLRRAIGGLRPIYLEDLGLVAALGMLAREMDAAGRLRVTFAQRGEERRLPPETEMAFYRIAQEALNNAAHHAGASNAWVELAFEDGSAHGSAQGFAHLSIRDDGRGFTVPEDPNAFARLGHYGLLGMRERAELAGAQIKIESAPGEGTRVEVKEAIHE